MKAFKAGADGVMILGCHPGECHYKEGNLQTLKRYAILKEVLPQFGIETDRLKLDWISASERDKFVEVVSEMVNKLRTLGPLQVQSDQPFRQEKA
jgi:F420-non-reducing hydrogenase iron-sulfur subunit